jgi:response regulator of citrate/malate metabolism
MNGIEYLAKLRQEHEDLTTPVVVLTCISSKEAVQQMVRLGITDYVVKADLIVGLSERIYDILVKVRII